MKTLLALVAVTALLLVGGQAMAGNTATQVLTFQIDAINEISVSGNPGTFLIQTATAGQQPDAVSDATTRYNITTNETNKKITAQITTGSDMPANTTLSILMDATGVGTAGVPSGGQDISGASSAQDTVTAISKKAVPLKTITYTFGATVDAGVLSSFQRTVTLTLTNG